MGEGAFKTRINGLGKLRIAESDHWKINKHEVLQIVEEAKHDFPLNPIIEAMNIYRDLRNHTEKERQVVIKQHLENCNLEQFILETIEWFVRWLDGQNT